jgi:hypothetical protein
MGSIMAEQKFIEVRGAREHNLKRFLLRDTDFSRDMQPEEHQKLMQDLHQTQGLEPHIRMGNTTHFSIK